MGEISDMIINGECCQVCASNFETPGRGYPFTCKECEGQDKGMTLEQILTSNGYMNVRCINGLWCGVHRYIFTVGVCYGLDETGYRGRFCFSTYQNAALFLKDWDGETPPEIGIDGCTAIK